MDDDTRGTARRDMHFKIRGSLIGSCLDTYIAESLGLLTMLCPHLHTLPMEECAPSELVVCDEAGNKIIVLISPDFCNLALVNCDICESSIVISTLTGEFTLLNKHDREIVFGMGRGEAMKDKDLYEACSSITKVQLMFLLAYARGELMTFGECYLGEKRVHSPKKRKLI